MAKTPAKVREALLCDPIYLLGQELQPFDTATFLFLEKLDSPLVLEEEVKGKSSRVKVEDMAVLAFILTRPLRESRLKFAQGRNVFDDAVSDFAATIPMHELKTVSETLGKYLEAAFATVTGASGQKKTLTDPSR